MRDDFEVMILPWDTDPNQVDCDGWIISNGPGNPMHCGNLLQNVHKILEQRRPALGICLGHQIMALAGGARTHRMAFGHRSHNQPVQLIGSSRCYMTTQNHSYVVDDRTLPEDWQPWFRNVNDQSIEGLIHRSKPFRTVQFHPEASAGPWDTKWILSQFQNELVRYHDQRAS